METVKAEAYQPKSWMDSKQEELARLDRMIQEMKAWIASSKKQAYTNTSAEQLGETIIQLQITERRRAHLRNAIKQVAALEERIKFIQSHH